MDARSEFIKETGNNYSTLIDNIGQTGFNPDYVLWLENKLSDLEKKLYITHLFAEFCGKYYIRLEKVWCHRYNNQTDSKNWLTTDQLFEFFMDIRNGVIGSLQHKIEEA